MAIDCPDNSTECLLRALIATTATQTSPWEPRSFGFTVAIGVAAFLISFVAIFQGLLAAGPGRIKGSKNAIGSFAKLTKGKLSLIEFAWRSTAQVPFITYEGLANRLIGQNLHVPHGKNYPLEAGNATTGATWLQLLRSVGLDEDAEGNFKDNLQDCPTDFLPADIQAPPAAIQLRCLAILASIADPTIKFQQVPRLGTFSFIGKASQISVRDHPVLGQLAAYEHYQTQIPQEHQYAYDLVPDAKRPYGTWGRCTRLALELAKGRLKVTWQVRITKPGEFVRELTSEASGTADYRVYQWHTTDYDHPQCLTTSRAPWAQAVSLMVAQTTYEVGPYPWKNARLQPAVDLLFAHISEALVSVDTLETYLAPSGCMEESVAYLYRNEDHDLIFESRGSWIPPDDPACDIGGAFSCDFVRRAFEDCMRFRCKLDGLPFAPHTKRREDPSHIYVGHISESWYLLKHIDILLRQKRLLAIGVLDELTQRLWTAGEPQVAITTNNFSKSGTCSEPISPRDCTNVLQRQDSGDATSPKTLTPPTASGSSDGSNASTQSSRPSTTSRASQRPTTVNPVVHSVKQGGNVEKCLEVLLVLRAISLASLLEAGPDTSILYSDDFEDFIIKMM